MNLSCFICLKTKKIIRYFLAIYVLLVSCLQLSGQSQQEKDSLLIELKKHVINDSLRVDILNKIADEYNKINLDSASQFIDAALSLASEIGYTRGMARAHYLMGTIHFYSGDFEAGFITLFEALRLYQKIDHDTESSRTLKNLAAFYQRTGDLPKAIFYGKEALELSKKVGDRLLAARIMNNLGNIYSDFDDEANMDTAKTMYNRALIIYKEFNIEEGISKALTNLGSLHYDLDELDVAVGYLEKSLIIDRKLNTDPFGLCAALNNLAGIYITKENYQKATDYLNESLQIAEKNAFKEKVKIVYSHFRWMYWKQGDYRNAYEMLREQQRIERQLVQSKQNKLIEELSAKYESEKKAQEIKNLENQAAIQALEIDRKNQNLLLLGILIVVLTLVVGLIYVIYRQKRITLARKADEIEQRLLRLQMNPHFIFNAMSSIQEFIMDGDQASATSYLTKFSRLIRRILEHSRNEYIPLDQEISLLDSYLSLQNLKRKTPFNYKIIVDEEIDTEELAIPPMFAQPFIENAIEHGLSDIENDASVEIAFALKEDQVELKITDNGVGVEAAIAKNASHKSLATQITKERIELFKRNIKKEISFKVSSAAQGSGTSVQFLLPCKYV